MCINLIIYIMLGGTVISYLGVLLVNNIIDKYMSVVDGNVHGILIALASYQSLSSAIQIMQISTGN